jgi:hypothetical protein
VDDVQTYVLGDGLVGCPVQCVLRRRRPVDTDHDPSFTGT